MNKSEMCRALAGHLRTLITLADLYRPAEVRQTGSRANLELAEDAALAHEAWGSTPVRFAQQDPSLRIAAHLDHVSAFAQRVQDDIVTPFALESIARGGIECAARVAWLYDAVDAPERVGKWLGDRIQSLEKERTAWGYLRTNYLTPKLDKRLLDYGAAAVEMGITPMKPPPYWQQVRDLLLTTGYAPNPGAFYAMNSGVGHGEMWALIMFARADGDSESESGSILIEQTDRRVATVAAYLLSAHDGLVSRFVELFGRPEGHDLWQAELDKARASIHPAMSKRWPGGRHEGALST